MSLNQLADVMTFKTLHIFYLNFSSIAYYFTDFSQYKLPNSNCQSSIVLLMEDFLNQTREINGQIFTKSYLISYERRFRNYKSNNNMNKLDKTVLMYVFKHVQGFVMYQIGPIIVIQINIILLLQMSY